MAAVPCVRVCLHFSDLSEKTCWFLVDFKKMPTIECIQRVIGRKFYKSETTSFKLTLKGSLLPAWESSFLLRDDDQVIVEQEATSHHSSEYWSKKRKPMTKSHFSPSAKHKSLGCTQTKNTGTSSAGNEEPVFAPETLQNNSVSTPRTEIEEQEKSNKKKKKKKSEGANELNVDIEEIPAPSKKQRLSKLPKKKMVTKESRPELIEVVRGPVKVVSSRSENPKDGKANLCDKSDHPDLKKIKSELIKVLDGVSVSSDKAILQETSDKFLSGKDVSKVVKSNSSEENTSFTQLTDSIEKCLRKNLEPSGKSSVSELDESYNIQADSPSHSVLGKGNTSLTQSTDAIGRGLRKNFCANSSISDVVKSYNVPKGSSSHSIPEKIEVYNIAKEDLKHMCQSLSEGETLTIDQDKVKVIDLENSSNSSWLDCVEVDSKSTSQETSKGSGTGTRRRRRRRGQRSFACSPFIHEINQSLDSEGGNRSTVSTPVARGPSSRNSSQKHFHFESDTEDEDVEEEKISQHTMTEAADDPKTQNNFDCSKSTLSSDNTVTNGAENSDSSFVLQGEEKDGISSSSEKRTPKKSVHFALENNSCQSFDSNQRPVIYKRGQNANQRRIYPTLIRQQQLNSVEDDRDATSVNCSKPSKEYNLLPGIVGNPRAGDKIAFKRLEIGDDYTPRLSDFIEAKVVSFQEDKKMLTIKVTSSQNNRRKDGKFELFYEDDKDIMILDQQDDITETVDLSLLQDVKLLK